MAAKPSIPKGTRDFSPVEMAKRNYISYLRKNTLLCLNTQDRIQQLFIFL